MTAFKLELEPIDYQISIHLVNLKLTYQDDKSILAEVYISMRLACLVESYGYDSVSKLYKLIFNLPLKRIKAA